MEELKWLPVQVIPVEELDDNFYETIYHMPLAVRSRGNNGGKNKREYVDMVTSFDIETTRLHDYEKEYQKEDRNKKNKRKRYPDLPDHTVMYIWQWAFSWKTKDGIATVCTYGRRWSDFKAFVKRLTKYQRSNQFIVVYDHNLSYEFQFLRGILPFAPEDTFNIRPRQPLKASSCGLEFRCSYKQSNMSLRKFAESMQTPHQKTELDYDEKRYWYTPLTDKELEYCVNDVICLNECIIKRMRAEGDTLYTIPLTSTGYVRREVRRAVQQSGKKTVDMIQDMMPDYDTYLELQEAFRGGNTHANRYYSNKLIESTVYGLIHSADRSSSYPAVICNCLYPMSKFKPLPDCSFENVKRYLGKYERALLMRCRMSNVRLKNIYWGCPYLSFSKCRKVKNELLDNGRVLSADYLETTITDVDLMIIMDEYDADIEFYDVKFAKYGKIPRCIIDEVIKYYVNKTKLKGVEGQEYFYTKNKNLLNSIYGMMVQALIKVLIMFMKGDQPGVVGEYKDDPDAEPKEILEKAEKKGFLNYAWGVWVTCWARYELERGIKLAGEGFLYCDTDSVKYIGEVDWTEYNNEKIKESMESGSHATDPKGNEHYMGVFEAEHDMEAFKTMGAKKYAYVSDGKLHITVAGVGKKSGVEELEKAAKKDGCRGIDEFCEGFEFTGDAGGLEAVYNDMGLYDTITETGEDDQQHRIVSNVTLRPSTYTLGLADDYKRLLEGTDFTVMDDLL